MSSRAAQWLLLTGLAGVGLSWAETASVTINKVRGPAVGAQLAGTEVFVNGTSVYRVGTVLPSTAPFPTPGDLGSAYAIAEYPRIVPPEWGATPMPDGKYRPTDPLRETTGWDVDKSAPDVYVFLEAGRGYAAARSEFLRLTGPIPMVPLSVLGFRNSKWWPCTDAQFLEMIDEYRARDFPLDVQMIDTDWRRTGYDIETQYFPDTAGFLKKAHDKHVKLVCNDHPQGGAMDPASMQKRWDGLIKHLGLGLDFCLLRSGTGPASFALPLSGIGEPSLVVRTTFDGRSIARKVMLVR